MSSIVHFNPERRSDHRRELPRIEILHDRRLVSVLGDLDRALTARPGAFRLRVEQVGNCGELVFCITGAKGRLPLRFGRDELEPAYVLRVVGENLDKFGF